ncbi:sigma-70 family RNA polymerase sigma factor [Kineosporia succinea]|uniref:RNA polymerase sigma-70 factor (ECF subfamily) n=1 Tax=Kineosporia succinea TaxID=84632 RepID=A0ABT9PDT1_9ACTN|nr:sigma-70 family RNA polymerase sigma factor [Kineosporia succinea]MDP9830872.1 RNA polymerase sigma-70 factor (ECF subfamily) [Kineosporia succinea]
MTSLSRRQADRVADAFARELYANHAVALLAYVNRMLDDPQQAEDVVQETVLRAWRHADRLNDEPAQLYRWLSTVARNICSDRIRARNARPTEVEESAKETEAAPDHSAQVVDTVLLAQALSGLSHKHRQALEHVYLAGYSTTEAAALIGVPVGTVKTRTHHALRRLRTRLAPEGFVGTAGEVPAPRAHRPVAAPGAGTSAGPWLATG